MDNAVYTKVYYGNFILATRIKDELEHVGIVPIIKDEGESQRLSGFASMFQDYREIFVHNEELEKAIAVVESVRAEMEASS